MFVVVLTGFFLTATAMTKDNVLFQTTDIVLESSATHSTDFFDTTISQSDSNKLELIGKSVFTGGPVNDNKLSKKYEQ